MKTVTRQKTAGNINYVLYQIPLFLVSCKIVPNPGEKGCTTVISMLPKNAQGNVKTLDSSKWCLHNGYVYAVGQMLTLVR